MNKSTLLELLRELKMDLASFDDKSDVRYTEKIEALQSAYEFIDEEAGEGDWF